MKHDDSVVGLVRAQKELEDNMVKALEVLEAKVHNEAARLILTELRIGSTKHASICQEILKTAEKPRRLIYGMRELKATWICRL